MHKFTFKGGIHPDDNKKSTNKIPIRTVAPSARMYFPLQQHIGAPLNPTVNIGDTVKMGQKIADTDAYMSVPLHSSVSGRVADICLYPHSSGQKVKTIVIENDGLDTPCEPINKKPVEKLSPKELITIIREAGIVGMGGAGFPTHVKLSPPPEKPISHLIVNGAECEPYLTSDHRVMLETPEEVIGGLEIVMKVLCLKKAYIGIEENKPDAIETLEKSKSQLKSDGIEIITLKKKYPQGAEKQLINAVTGLFVPSGGLPMDVGAAVVNIDTVTAVYRAAVQGIPLYRRIVTIAGSAMKAPCNLSVRIGMPFKEVIEAGGGFGVQPAKIIMGGPMMGIAQYNMDVPVVKGTSAILAFTEKDAKLRTESACLRCGRCVMACPMHLVPLELNMFTLKNDLDRLEEFNVLDCIECGSCSFVCPAKRHLVQSIRVGKQKVQSKRAAERARKGK